VLGLVAAAVLVLVLVQVPLAVFVSIDAHRRHVEHPEQYVVGTLVAPLLGLALSAWYLSNRATLPRREPPETGADGGDTTAGRYRVTLPGFGNLPRRLACVFATERWLPAALVAVPPVLLGAGLVVSPAIGPGYFAWCVSVVALALSLSRRFREVTVDIDRATGQLTATFTPGPYTSHTTREVDLSTVASTSFTRVGDEVVVRLDSEKPFAGHTLVVPADRVESVAADFEACGVEIPGHVATAGLPPGEGLTPGRARLYTALGAVTSVLSPVAVAVVRPDLFALSTPLLVFGLVLVWLAGSWLVRRYDRRDVVGDSSAQ